jgi:SP family arabinose:H+ symporter-like MFS transporter
MDLSLKYYLSKRLYQMSRNTLYYSISIALGGLLLGYTASIFIVAEQATLLLERLTDGQNRVAVWSALLIILIGTLTAAMYAEACGRRSALFWTGVLYFVSAFGPSIVSGLSSFLIFGGFGCLALGATLVIVPIYIVELSPRRYRGELVGFFQLNIVLGVLFAYLLVHIMPHFDIELGWSMLVGFEALPALLFILLMRWVPESPRWLLIKRKDVEGARAVFLLNDESDIEATIERITSTVKQNEKVNWPNFWRLFFHIAFFSAFFQFSGISVIIYYSPRILSASGLDDQAIFLTSVGMGVVYLVFTLIAMHFIDRVGRKTLMYFGSVGLLVTLVLLAISFQVGIQNYSIPIYMLCYMGFFAISQGAVIWTFLPEISPNELRAYGQSFGSLFLMLLGAGTVCIFPWRNEQIGEGFNFFVFAALMVLQLIFVGLLMPETSNKSLEELRDKY